jgi:hypothetical protein
MGSLYLYLAASSTTNPNVLPLNLAWALLVLLPFVNVLTLSAVGLLGIESWTVHCLVKWRGFGTKMSEPNVQCCRGICLA